MKSSTTAVFTRQNPFMPEHPLGKAHYNPSRIQKLTKQQKKTTLSPVRHTQPSSPPQTHALSPEDQRFVEAANHLVVCRPATENQPSFSECWPSTDLGSSPANTTPSPKTPCRPEATAAQSMLSGRAADHQDSVLAKYVERFRHGRPQSREERQQMASGGDGDQQPFWWLSTSPLPTSSSTPTQSSHRGLSTVTDECMATALSPVELLRRGTNASPCRGLLDLSAGGLSDCSLGDLGIPGNLGDADIQHIQERASRLLQRTEHSVSSGSIPISSEGVGCSDFSSPVSVEEPVHRPIIPIPMGSNTVNAKMTFYHAGPVLKPPGPPARCSRPEEDILFQWRLRRKMEQARQWPQSLAQQGPASYLAQTVPWQHNKVQHAPPAELPDRVIPSSTSALQGSRPAASPSPSLPISSPTVSKLQSDARLPAHMHHLCDILPCPVQPSTPSPRQKSPQRRKLSVPNLAHRQTAAPASSTDTITGEDTAKPESSPPPVSSESTEEEWRVHQSRAERKSKGSLQRKQVDKRLAASSRKKKSVRPPGGEEDRDERPVYAERSAAPAHHSRGSEVTQRSEEVPRDTGLLETGQGSARGDRAPPPSPIHSAIEQVISGVLFPTPDSPPSSSTPVSSDSLRYTPPAPPQSPAPPAPILLNSPCFTPPAPISLNSPCFTPPAPPPDPQASAPQPSEVISQLLQEAIDSDGTEFEDDPLLQVLRKQRKWVKEQMSEVDSMLDGLK